LVYWANSKVKAEFTLVSMTAQRVISRLAKRGFMLVSDWFACILQFYPRFFERVYPEGNFSYHHLWFLAYLLVYSFLALPLFAALRTERGGEFIRRFAA